MVKHDRRSPARYTREDRIEARDALNDDTKTLISMRAACILMDISVPIGYQWAKQNIFPGAVSVTSKTRKIVKVNREILKAFLYNIPYEGAGDATHPQPQAAEVDSGSHT